MTFLNLFMFTACGLWAGIARVDGQRGWAIVLGVLGLVNLLAGLAGFVFDVARKAPTDG